MTSSRKAPTRLEFRWGEFMEERARMIRYFRDVNKLDWREIAEKLSLDPTQASLIYAGTCGRKS